MFIESVLLIMIYIVRFSLIMEEFTVFFSHYGHLLKFIEQQTPILCN